MTVELGHALAIFIGKGYTKAPYPDENRLIETIGRDLSDVYMPRIRKLLDELSGFEIDWSDMDLNEATDYVIARMRSHHPDLSEEGVLALDWFFSWANR